MSNFLRIPKRNIWRLIFDIRPAGAILESPSKALSYLDLRVMRRSTFVAAKKPAALPRPTFIKISVGFLVPVLRQALVLVAVITILGGVFWTGNIGIAYIESRKSDIAAALGDIASTAGRGTGLMTEMRFEEAEREFRTGATALRGLETTMAPALLAISISALVLPESDYVKTMAMLRDARTVFSAAADFNQAAGELARILPAAVFRGEENLFSLLDSTQTSLAALDSAMSEMEANRNSFSDAIAGEWLYRLPATKLALQDARQAIVFFETLLGRREPFTILLLFQDPAEIRPTGGLLRNYGILRMEQGKIAQFRTGDFDNDSAARERQEDDLPVLMPPRPLQYRTPFWKARDANWFFDFGLSAERAAFFVSETSGDEFNLVAATNPETIAALIDLIGPIQIPEHETIITADNFWREAQLQARAGEDPGTRESVLATLWPLLLEKFETLPSSDLPQAARIFLEGLAEKDVLLWSPDQELQSLIVSRGWSGKVAELNPEEDYLAVVLSNIGGGQADYVTRQSYGLETTIDPSGIITNSLTITRTHDRNRAPDPWRNSRNLAYIRVFVPKGSTLLAARGTSPEPRLLQLDPIAYEYILDPDITMTIGAALELDEKHVEIFEESERTVFGFWQAVNPGQTRRVTLSWRLPFRANFAPPHYSLIFQKQSGVRGVFQQSISLPTGSSVLSVEPLAAGAGRAVIGDRFSWVAQDMNADIRHAISYQLR